MIRYSLICDAGHSFDSWFRDSAGFEKQAAEGQIACPFCELDEDCARRHGAPYRQAARRRGA